MLNVEIIGDAGILRGIYDRTDPRREEHFLHDVPGTFILKAVREPAFENIADLALERTENRTIIVTYR